ncbi:MULTISPECIES: PTS sugar transporter subunit IIA [unclassified Fibrobacter]|uniref:PTS sugar transporter subunit IIA n=1 Tax=unclassified Fibrobacter TaxID=2634177 RepID=UPI000D6AEFB9|nr:MULTISPECIES: PTS sugar transporter subunit IIA [unclassified Fibrobacter]PWJ70022.1 PTS system nitrogen regulatory IIA component [Fibrobacter sp. UWR4]PZW73193.1 PTS system nitrogen regulatory IIA component [Fibrobacter sp. UWR1]
MALVYTKFYAGSETFGRALGFAYDALVHGPCAFDANTTWAGLVERVRQGVYMGEGLLLPHTRVKGLAEPLMAFVVCPEGLSDIEIRGGEKAQFMCVLLSPAESATAHTTVIADMAKKMLNPEWKEKALLVKSDAEIRDLFE